MPYKDRSGLVSSQFAIDFKLKEVYRQLVASIEAGVERTAYQAETSARQRAPVRKIFKGGRQLTRKLTHRERFTSLLQMGMSQSEVIRTLSTGGGPQRIVTSRNRAQSWNTTMIPLTPGQPSMRQVDTLSRRHLAYLPFEKRLDARGHYELRTGRALSEVTGQEASKKRASLVEGTDKAEFTVGGGLRRSIHSEDRTTPGVKVKQSIVAGNEKVDYARYVEFGTRHAAAQPFLRPALKHVEGKLFNNVLTALRRTGIPGRQS